MDISERLRHNIFWMADRLKGMPIGRHFQELQSSFDEPRKGWEIANQRLQEFMSHICATTKFYKKFKGKQFEEFPVIQKKIMKENYNEFLSSAYNKNELLTTTTSGSYGMPFTFYLTKEKRARQQAEVIFFSRFAGYEVGMKFAHIRAQKRSRLILYLTNSYIMDPCIIDLEWLEKQRQIFKKKGIKAVVAYPSAIMPIVNYCLEKGDGPEDFKMVGVICSAETLSDIVRRQIKKLFGCTVLDRYSSNELGTITHELAEEKGHYTNFTTHKIELLEMNNDEPITAPGKIGRVVVTDLFSHAMPLVRYDTGDLAVWADKSKCDRDIPAFEKVEGRIVETLIRPDGKMVNFSAIDIIPKYFSDIIQFQFIQETQTDYRVKLQVMKSFNQEKELLQNCKEVFGQESNFKIEYVDQIESLPSGKRPYVINKFKTKI